MKLLNTQKGLSFLGLYRTEPVAEEFALADKKPSSRNLTPITLVLKSSLQHMCVC